MHAAARLQAIALRGRPLTLAATLAEVALPGAPKKYLRLAHTRPARRPAQGTS